LAILADTPTVMRETPTKDVYVRVNKVTPPPFQNTEMSVSRDDAVRGELINVSEVVFRD
jgi:hypothetical protein